MNKEDFGAGLATLQAQLDAAERTLNEAKAAYGEARRALRGHVAYGKARGWIERAKRSKPDPIAEAAE